MKQKHIYPTQYGFLLALILISCRQENKIVIPLKNRELSLEINIPESYDTAFKWIKLSDYDCQNYLVTSFANSSVQSFYPDTIYAFSQLNFNEMRRNDISIYEELDSSCNNKSIEEWNKHIYMVYGGIKFNVSHKNGLDQWVGNNRLKVKDYVLNQRIVYLVGINTALKIVIEDNHSDSSVFIMESDKIIDSIRIKEKTNANTG